MAAEWFMNHGRTVFAQLLSLLPDREFPVTLTNFGPRSCRAALPLVQPFVGRDKYRGPLQHMQVDENHSPSFRALRDKIRELASTRVE
jgi:hypothetical protein